MLLDVAPVCRCSSVIPPLSSVPVPVLPIRQLVSLKLHGGRSPVGFQMDPPLLVTHSPHCRGGTNPVLQLLSEGSGGGAGVAVEACSIIATS